jgi:SAM-dependent MidA family methyltransferase
MEAALYHPQFGYYSRSDLKRWGRDGDYRTSPERSELFSATFARYFANLYERLGQPDDFLIVEFGAGNGNFAGGVLRYLAEHFTSIYAKTSYVIVDRSLDALRRCAENIKPYTERIRFLTADQIIATPAAIVFSNELLDAFPVHRIRRVGGELKELYVDYVDDRFKWTVDSPSSEELVEFVTENAAQIVEGQTVEVNLGIRDWLSLIEKSVVTGFVVTVDYGSEGAQLYDPSFRFDGTLRAFKQHRFVDNFLEIPGECDITSSVDWTIVMKEGKRLGMDVDSFERLDQFMLNAGLLSELESRLANVADDGERSQLTTSAREMILPGGMASSFQILVQRRGVDER